MKRFFKRLPAWIVPPLVLVGLGVLGHVTHPRGNRSSDTVARDEADRCLARIRRRILEECVAPPAPDDLFDGAVAGMLRSIPYADLFPLEDAFRDSVEGECSGIGVCFARTGKALKAVRLLEGSPAAGILAPGDEILALDGRDASGLSLAEAWHASLGPPGSTCLLRIRRAGKTDRLECRIPRKKVRVPSVPGARFLAGGPEGTAYVRISAFHTGTAREFGRMLDRFEGRGLRALVLDLRFNTGGLLEEAVRTANFFVPEGLLLRVEGRRPETRKRYTASRSDCRLHGLPCVVLVNGRTASAAEALAGMLRERAGARLVGTRTLGKGAVQTAFVERLGERRFVVRIPTALFYLPSGVCVDRRLGNRGKGGLPPDRVVPLPRTCAQRLEKNLDLLALAWDREVPKEKGRPDRSFDPQLVVALELLSARPERKTGEEP